MPRRKPRELSRPLLYVAPETGKLEAMGSDELLVAHTGDWHLTWGPKFEQTLKVLHWIAQDAIRSNAQLFLCSGDVAGVTVPHNMTTYEELALINVFQEIATRMPVVIVYGNHDAPGDLDVFKELRATHQIYVASRPEVFVVPFPWGNAFVHCLPYPSKRWMSHEFLGGLAGEKTWMEGGLRKILGVWQGPQPGPKIFLSHINIGGSKVAGGEVLIGQEIELSPSDLNALNMDYCALGHIHLTQQIGPKSWYAGSPDRSNFGEPDEKSYHLVKVKVGEMPVIERKMTPTKPYITIEATWGPDGWTHAILPVHQLEGAEVKLRYGYRTDEPPPKVDELVALLRENGAENVVLDPRPEAVVRLRSEEMARATTVEEKVTAWWNTLGEKGPSEEVRKRCLEKIGVLRDES